MIYPLFNFFIGLLICTLLCNAQEPPPKETLWVTIIVHGALTLRPYLTLPNLLRLMRDEIQGTVYQCSVDLVRDDPYIYQTQAMQDRGLQSVDMHDDRQSASATLFCTLYDMTLKTMYPERTKTSYYTYGWSGLFSHSVRLEEGRDFYERSKNLRTTLEAQFPDTIIHITAIGYSHGGNVILAAGDAYQRDDDKSFFFDEVVLIGTPIQYETKGYAGAALFKKIYVYYSQADKAVVMDCFSFKRFFSCRYFNQQGSRLPPHNMCQIEVRFSDRKTFSRKKHRKKPPKTYFKHVDYSPGHTELWSFGWIGSGFRPHFPLYPMPIGVLLPYLKRTLETYESPMLRHFTQHIHYDTNIMTIMPRFCLHTYKVPFLPREFIKRLQDHIEEKRPKNFLRGEYEARFTSIVERVSAERICQRKENARRNICRINNTKVQTTKCLQ